VEQNPGVLQTVVFHSGSVNPFRHFGNVGGIELLYANPACRFRVQIKVGNRYYPVWRILKINIASFTDNPFSEISPFEIDFVFVGFRYNKTAKINCKQTDYERRNHKRKQITVKRNSARFNCRQLVGIGKFSGYEQPRKQNGNG